MPVQGSREPTFIANLAGFYCGAGDKWATLLSMLLNPFTPTEIASQPNDFYGRSNELSTLERSLAKGSVVIHGPMGIGKSSLMARARLHMEGFASEQPAESVIIVGNKSIETVDDAARCLVQEMLSVDEQHNKIKFAFGSLFEFENAEVVQNFRDKHHLAVAMRSLKAEYLDRALSDQRMFVIAVDESEKCPIPIAQLVRALVTHAQQHGIRGLRFMVTGVSPFFEKMLTEDPGISRFFYKSICLEPLEREEARDLIEQKLREVVLEAKSKGHDLRIDPSVISRIVALSGGHPHLLQLLGSHLIEHEENDPDGVIDTRDLYDSLIRVCYEDRAAVYGSLLHELELYNHLDSLHTLLGFSSESPQSIVKRGFPTRIDRQLAQSVCEAAELSWFVSNNILRVLPDDKYGLVDEFLRVRLVLDQAELEYERDRLQLQLVEWKMVDDF